MNLSECAKLYYNNGLVPLPVHNIDPVSGFCSCGKKNCPSAGKHPRLNAWQKADIHAADLDKWFSDNSAASIGVRTGKLLSGNGYLVVVDIDAGKGASLESLRVIGELPDTVTCLTGGGGWHLYYLHDQPVSNSVNGLMQGVDIRCKGGFVVAPPSVHRSGNSYRWEAGKAPGEIPIAPLPDWIADRLLGQSDDLGQNKISEPTAPATREGKASGQSVIESCLFMCHCKDNARALTEPEWHSMISNLALCSDGAELCHELSSEYPGYTAEETDSKINQCLKQNKPHTCEQISRFYPCPAARCGVKAPVVFAVRAYEQAELDQARERVRGINNNNAFELVNELVLLQKKDYDAFAKAMATVSKNKRLLKDAIKAASNTTLAADDFDAYGCFIEGLGDFICPRGFKVNNDGIYKYKNEGTILISSTPAVISRVIADAKGVDPDCYEITFLKNGEVHKATGEASRLLTSGERGIVTLAGNGLNVSSYNAKDMVEYLHKYTGGNPNIPRQKTVKQLGWHCGRFFPGYENGYTLSAGGYLTSGDTLEAAGELKEWSDLVRPMLGNPFTRFILAVSFASPLLHKLSIRNIIAYIQGHTGGGKTALQRVCASVWAKPSAYTRNLQDTVKSLAQAASFYCHLPMIINELQGSDKGQRDMDRLIYLLAEGKTQGRLTITAEQQKRYEFNLAAIVSGEASIFGTVSENGTDTRCITVKNDCFIEDAAAKAVYEWSEHLHGTAGRSFIGAVMKNGDTALRDAFQLMLTEIERMKTGAAGSHQAFVVVVCLADYIAQQVVFGIEAKEAWEGSVSLANTILWHIMGNRPDTLESRAMGFIDDWIASNRYRFDFAASERYGISDAEYVYIIPACIERAGKEAGFSKSVLVDAMLQSGRLRLGNGSFTVLKRFGKEVMRVYALKMVSDIEGENVTT